MAIVRKTLDDIKASRPKSDRRRIAATSEDEIRRQRIEDGEDPEAPVEGFAPSAKTLRLQHGMTQEQFAAALHIPVAHTAQLGAGPGGARSRRAILAHCVRQKPEGRSRRFGGGLTRAAAPAA